MDDMWPEIHVPRVLHSSVHWSAKHHKGSSEATALSVPFSALVFSVTLKVIQIFTKDFV